MEMRSISRIIIVEISEEIENAEEVIYSITKMQKKSILAGELEIDINQRKACLNGEDAYLTKLEFDLLLYLSSQPERVFTYEQIYETVWGEPYAYEKNNIMTHISHLRAKIEPDPAHPRYIENVRGVGYRFKKQ